MLKVISGSKVAQFHPCPYPPVPVAEMLIYLLNGLSLIFFKSDALPLFRRVRDTLRCLYIKVNYTISLFNCGILGISKRAGVTIAQSSHVIFIAAKPTCLGFYHVWAKWFANQLPCKVVWVHIVCQIWNWNTKRRAMKRITHFNIQSVRYEKQQKVNNKCISSKRDWEVLRLMIKMQISKIKKETSE